MKKAIAALMSAVLCLGMLSGCGQTAGPARPEKTPPVMIAADENGTPFEVSASGYTWDWDNGDGTQGGSVADAVHPLDESILKRDRLDVPEGAVFHISFAMEPESLSYIRWDASSVGSMDAQAREKLAMAAPFDVALKPGSVYCFTAVFPESDAGGGRADYYLVTAGEGEAESFESPLDYIGSAAYSRWWSEMREAISSSEENQQGIEEYYARLLPILLSDTEDNSVCSPLNIYLALSILAETAGGETRSQILDVLNVPDMDTMRQRARALCDANMCDNPLLKSLPANSLWMQEGYPYNTDTIDILRDVHRAGAYAGIMGSEEFVQALRDWTDEHTGGLLKEFTSRMTQDPETRLELVSTLYFKASWSNRFSAELTDTGVFRGVRGDEDCDMMHMSQPANYYWGDGFSAVSLSLSESGAMFFFLPDEGTPLSDVIANSQTMDLTRSEYTYENSRYLIVNMSIPKFTVSDKTDLKDALSALGITDAFDRDAADFTPLTAEKYVFLGKADHAAAVSIDEEGVTGAAYTDLGLCGAGMPPTETVDFVLDRPFYFAITARDGSVLFAGTVLTVGE